MTNTFQFPHVHHRLRIISFSSPAPLPSPEDQADLQKNTKLVNKFGTWVAISVYSSTSLRAQKLVLSTIRHLLQSFLINNIMMNWTGVKMQIRTGDLPQPLAELHRRLGLSHCEWSRYICHCPLLQGTIWLGCSEHHVGLFSHSHWLWGAPYPLDRRE